MEISFIDPPVYFGSPNNIYLFAYSYFQEGVYHENQYLAIAGNLSDAVDMIERDVNPFLIPRSNIETHTVLACETNLPSEMFVKKIKIDD